MVKEKKGSASQMDIDEFEEKKAEVSEPVSLLGGDAVSVGLPGQLREEQ